MILSTCISDLIMALACGSAGAWLWCQAETTRRYAAIGMALMALAAGLGAARYGGVGGLERVHVGASHLAGAVAPGCFALVAAAVAWAKPRRFVEAGLAALTVLWLVFEYAAPWGAYRTAIGSFAVALMLVVAARARSRAGGALAIGALALALAGLVIGTKGQLGPFAAIDVFHGVLALAHLLVAYGLVYLVRRR